MRSHIKLLCILLSVLMLASVPIPAVALPEADTGSDYRTYLRTLGFPEDYIEPLYELHLLHPTWSFEPLDVTSLNSKYTWDYVIHMETEDSPQRSLISSNSAYTAYRHKTNTQLYDSGWYQASTTAVEYFMDPRNFLNEKDIFQFEDLRYRDTVTKQQVETALDGTFMANAKLENGLTYTEYFIEVGKRLGINPLHLASRARQEQGLKGGGSNISGVGGDKLWYYYSNNIQTEDGAIVYAPTSGHTEDSLRQYNGLYNFYNINASGTGRFAILLGAMKEAKTGTADMAAEWGGSPSWDTRWKSIYGGAYKLSKSYISNYQNTLYLQKWNVDARSKSASGGSRNFWGQYMQNAGAALTEARNSYNAMAQNDCLDCAYTFLIPIYADMPTSCPDPAGGKCEFYAVSSTKYSYVNDISMATCSTSVRNDYYKFDGVGYTAGMPLNITGNSMHTSGVEAFEYSFDGKAWQTMDTHPMEDGITPTGDLANFNVYTDHTIPFYFTSAIPSSAMTVGTHTAVVRGRVRFDAEDTALNNCRYYLVALITITAKERNCYITVNDIAQSKQDSTKLGQVYTLPQASKSPDKDTHFAGWRVEGNSTAQFLPAGAGITVTENLTLTPIYVYLAMRHGAAVQIAPTSRLRFCAAIDYDGYTELNTAAGALNVSCGMIICETPPSGLATLHPDSLALSSIGYKKTVAASWCQNATASGEYYGFFGDTDGITAEGYSTVYSATAYIRVIYSNSVSSYICADYDAESSARSVKSVAAAALASTYRTYTDVEKIVLAELAK